MLKGFKLVYRIFLWFWRYWGFSGFSFGDMLGLFKLDRCKYNKMNE